MKRIRTRLIILILSLISLIIIMTVVISGEVKNIETEINYKDKLIRFHVIPNSNSEEDQELKIKVRDEVIDYLEPKLSESESIQESEKIIMSEYDNLQRISKNIIQDNGYDYEVKIDIEYSNFPAKQYSNVVLPAGEYKALKVIIGEGQGNNWWCVMFPPLCFIDEDKSIIDSDTDEKLREVLTEEEYDLIVQQEKASTSGVNVKFKFVELIQEIFRI